MRRSLSALLIFALAAGCAAHEDPHATRPPQAETAGAKDEAPKIAGVPAPVAVAGAVGIGIGLGALLLAGLSAVAAASLMSGG
jgi:hypothetical protein